MVASITRWQGYTGGVSRIVSRVAGSLRKHRSAIHEARPAAGVPAWLTLTPHTSSGVPCSYIHMKQRMKQRGLPSPYAQPGK